MTKIDIISGFLGAGKTTLIKKLIEEGLKGQKVVLIENEFGEIGIDGGFLKESGIQINEMNSGCICCSLVGDFNTALKDVLEQYTPDRIIIEPSGVGKLSDVMKAVQKVVDAEENVVLNSHITVADAMRAKMYLKNFGEFYRNQVEFASAVILSRSQNVKEDKLEKAVALLRDINGKCPIVTTPWEELSGAQLLEVMEGENDFAKELMEAAQVCTECGHHHEHGEECHEHHHDHDHECHEHHHDHDHAHGAHHHHSSLHDIEHIVRDHLPVSDRVKDDIMAVYQLIAQAESAAHGVPVDQIHFHEVGTMDAVADITAVCMLMEELSVDQVIVSPVHVGSGKVRCAHGILPVPAPATAYILKDVPIYGGRIQGELCTPTGAALLKHFATKFGDMPVMKTKAIGYGMGKKDFEMANCVRAMLGETADDVSRVSELCCNIDDMTAEEIGFATETILAAGALEVFTVSTGMKKSRPGILLEVMCREEDRDRMIELIFLHTTTLGVREQFSRRYTMTRSIKTIKTPYGDVRKKVSTGYGTSREKYEYEDLASIARKQGISIREARQTASDFDK